MTARVDRSGPGVAGTSLLDVCDLPPSDGLPGRGCLVSEPLLGDIHLLVGFLGAGRRAQPPSLAPALGLSRHLLSKRSRIPYLPGLNDYLRMCPNLSKDSSEIGPRQQPGVLLRRSKRTRGLGAVSS